MPSLRELQRNFSAAVIFEDRAAIASLGVVAAGMEPARRVAVYRNNILGNYRAALAITYPVVRRLVGGAFFDAAADVFSRGHPSVQGDVNRYGGSFASFLAAYVPARELKYLPDVARLEWALDQSNIAGDRGPIDTSALAKVSPDALAGLRFVLHPGARLIASPYPVLHIWRSNQPDGDAAEHIDLGEGGDFLLIRRADDDIVIERIGAGEYALLNALAANATLGAATDQAATTDPAFDLGAALRRFVSSQTIVAFRAMASNAYESQR
jgi:Putative DNA-binding domain